MKKGLQIVLMMFLSVIVTSCFQRWDDDDIEDLTKNIDVVLNLRVPQGFASAAKSRSLSVADENTIDNAYVLVFDNTDQLTAIEKATDLEISHKPGDDVLSGTGTIVVSLEPSKNASDTYKIVVLGNAEDLLNTTTIGTDFSLIVGTKSYSDLVSELNKSGLTGKLFSATGDNRIPMWGETGLVVISPTSSSITLTMMRSVARIDVGVGAPTHNTTTDEYTWSGIDPLGQPIPFELQEVYVFRGNDSYSVIPASGNVNGTSVTAPSVPVGTNQFNADATDASKFKYEGADITSGLYTTRSIYVPESDVKINAIGKSGDADHENRMAIVVGGDYNNSGITTYYRIDFAPSNGDIINVLRNHLYQFNIKEIKGEGYADPVSAYKSVAMNMEVNILEWNETNMNDIIFDGDCYFSIEKREVTFNPMGGESLEVKIKSNFTDWSMNTPGSGVIGPKNPTYNNSTYGYNYTLISHGGDSYTLSVSSSKPNVSESSTDPRKEEFEILTGRHKSKFTVQQQYTNCHISIQNGSTVHLLPEGGSVPIEIMNLKPVTIEVLGDGNGSWFPLGNISGLSTPSGDGLYSARFSVDVGTFNLDSFTSFTGDKRAVTVKITPQGESPITMTVEQEKPYLEFIPAAFYIPRGGNVSYTAVASILTNLTDLTLARNTGYDLDNSRVVADAKGFYGRVFSRDMKFDVIADLSSSPSALPDGSFGAEYVVSVDVSKYGSSLSGGIAFVIPSTTEVFDWSWDLGTAGDKTLNYVFPWNVSSAALTVTSNRGLLWDDVTAGVAKPAWVTLGSGVDKGTGSLAHKVSFAMSKSDNMVVDTYSSYFNTYPLVDASSVTKSSVSFKHGVQYMSGVSTFPDRNKVGWDGVSQVVGYKSVISSNLVWTASIKGSVTWAKIQNASGVWGRSATYDGRVSLPIASSSYNSSVDMVSSHDLLLSFDAFAASDINVASDRTITLSFSNDSYDAVLGGASAPSDVVITQYAPVLSLTSSTLPADGIQIPGNGVIYAFTVSTNIEGWGLKVYEGTDNTGTLLASQSGTSVIDKFAAVSDVVTLAVPANTSELARSLSIYLTNSMQGDSKFVEYVQPGMSKAFTGYWSGDIQNELVSEGTSYYYDKKTYVMTFDYEEGLTSNWTWADAVSKCKSYGDGTWVLPNRYELWGMFLTHYPRPSMTEGWWQPRVYWSSTERGTSSWYVHFYGGKTSTNAKTISYPVRCVRPE